MSQIPNNRVSMPIDSVERRMESNRGAMQLYKYPEELGSEGSEVQHWILFTIYDTIGANLESKVQSEPAPLSDPATNRTGIVPTTQNVFGKGYEYVWAPAAKRAPGVYRGVTTPGQNIPASSTKESEMVSRQHTGLRGKTELIPQAIAIYMPNEIKFAYGATYEGNNFSFVSGAKSFVEALAGNPDPKKLQEVLYQMGITKGLAKLTDVAASIFGADTNLHDVIKAATRKELYPHMEFLFRSINQREFSLTFDFAPRSAAETRVVNDIINVFKVYSHPQLTSGGRLQLFPAEFEMQFFVNGSENLYIPRYSRLALTGIDVDYTPDATWASFREDERGSSPVHTRLTLNFRELEILHRQRIEEGY